MDAPPPLELDADTFVLACRDEEGLAPYVDVRLDTLPQADGDVDYSESPAALRKAANWLLAAADWLESVQ
jgi:hypothetical protein